MERGSDGIVFIIEMQHIKILFFSRWAQNPKNVIFNNPATIVFWSDGTKTVVKAGPNDIFDPEKGLAMAISKKMLGNNYKAYGRFKKWLPKEYNNAASEKWKNLLRLSVRSNE